MPETIEEKIAKSTGDDTERYSKELENEAEDLIKQTYHSEEEAKDDNKTNENESNDNNDEGDSGEKSVADIKGDETGEEDKGVGGQGDSDPNIDDNSDSNDDVVLLKEQLEKAQKQVKDNKAEFTRRSQELSEANKQTSFLEQNVFDLKNEIADLKSKLESKQSEAKIEPETKRDISKINERLKAIDEVDPDIAKAISPVIEDLVGQINSLQSKLDSSTENANKTAQSLAEDAYFRKIDDAHPGWEDTFKSDEFKEYIDGLSARQKKLALADLESGTAEDVIEIFTDFKSTQNMNGEPEEKPDRKQEKLNAAKNLANPKFNKSKEINSKAQKVEFTRSQIDAMTPEEFAKNESAIDAAMAKGLISNE